MSNKENLNKKNECNCTDKFEVAFEEEKAKVDPSKPCDSSNPDYPWVSCGVDKKTKDSKEK
ncbi:MULTISPECIES: hypothetical protein [Clostridium]|uniref:Uncharacterized protein n=1 Tax=Clostridium botulinum (strain Eklund 17B / Type B) TaxID=935198 RepID=B2THZ8_CLOBB|nr:MULTISPECIES: hypothetical protein [Clostridium]ACD24425.1 hypothetical protein CLL_A0139 [Clostridium botulinum B str. Eklund 17B (NRP)]MBN1053850.1 hypothetical protein [Clostridium botulinum]MBY6977327.1 hypothetical protein [Clostridium botulinum]MBY7001883.1 hypothetical protein [Clostridium botulinum]MCR1275672.1 hypothetical protein [Clostridium botulinum]